MQEEPFILGQVYRRRDIQNIYGGTRQGGIAPCRNYPYIFIFSGESGQQHGYKDKWENPNVFSYTGEGQINDMRFVRGNLALRDHLQNGKRVFLFTYVATGFVKFESELEVVDVDFFKGHDREGNERTAIKFFFKRVNAHIDYIIDYENKFVWKNDEINYKIENPTITERKGLVTSRVGQGAYRKSILFRWEFKCAVTNYSKNEILIASHIVPWKESSNDERLDVDNGILLSPTYDALFDQHLISFDNSGEIIISDTLTKTNYNLIGVSGRESIKKLSDGNKSYLERHRRLLT